MIHIHRITRRYRDSTAEIRRATTKRLHDELEEERISAKLVEEHNNRQRERRSTLYYMQS